MKVAETVAAPDVHDALPTPSADPHARMHALLDQVRSHGDAPDLRRYAEVG